MRPASTGLLLVALVTLGLAGCATVSPPVATTPLDWDAVAEENWSVQLVTRDPEGETRVTRAWIATLDGHGAMRTGGTWWLEDLRRDPRACLRVDGVDHPLEVELVEDPEEAERVARALRDKYGWQERWLMALRPRSGRDAFLVLRPRDDGSGCPAEG